MKLNFASKLFILSCLSVLLPSCTGIQIYTTSNHQAISLQKGDLTEHGLAFLTPTSPTGYEQDKQALAFGFADTLKVIRKDLTFISLPATLGAVNRADLTDEYKNMYQEYSATGILEKDTLAKISKLVNARYFALLNLGQFSTGTNNRFGLLGLRLVDTKYSNIRVFLQIWDGQTGAVAWESMAEVNYSDETISETPITFRKVVEEAARLMLQKLP